MKTFKNITLLAAIVASTCSCEFIDELHGKGDGKGSESKPLIIAHRGAQSLLPEHTIEGFEKAIELGADYIEPDLVLTKDGHLVVRHEPYLSSTTNVADLPEFAHLQTTKVLDGRTITDWFSTDFTLEEIKTLKARQAYAGRSTAYDDMFEIPTFEEVLDLVKSTLEDGEAIGVYPEIKHPYFHNTTLDLVMEDILLEDLEKANLNSKKAPVFVQCFEVAPLQYINERSSVKLVQLVSLYRLNADGSLDFNAPEGESAASGRPYDFYASGDERTYEFFTTEEGMAFTATYADGIGPWKPFIIPFATSESGEITLLEPTNFVDLAHKNGLKVHPYTFRNENTQWSGGDPEAEYHLFFDAGVDGLFTDYTDEAVKALATWKQ